MISSISTISMLLLLLAVVARIIHILCATVVSLLVCTILKCNYNSSFNDMCVCIYIYIYIYNTIMFRLRPRERGRGDHRPAAHAGGGWRTNIMYV